MIIDIPSTTSSAINKKLVDLREKGGANTQGRVLTLVIVTDEGAGEEAIEAANGASFEHPCRVIVVAKGSKRGTPRLDAQIRVGGDAGASEVIVLRLYGALADHGAAVVVPLLLPDAPVVAWWPGEAPEVPSEDPIGKLAQRRITDANTAKRPIAQLQARAKCYAPGDTDLAWTRITQWRGVLASALDQPPHEKITSVTVTAAADSVSAELLAGWLALNLRVPIKRVKGGSVSHGLHSVELVRRNSQILLSRPDGSTATLTVTGQPDRQLPLAPRILRDCIAEELRRLDADDVYSEVLDKGIALLDKQVTTAPAKAPAKTPAKAPARARAVKTPAAKAVAAKAPAAKVAAGRTSAAAKAAAGDKAAAAEAPAASKAPTAARRTRAAAAKPATTGSAATKRAAAKAATESAEQVAPAAKPAARRTAKSPAAAPKAGTVKATAVKAAAPKAGAGKTAAAKAPAAAKVPAAAKAPAAAKVPAAAAAKAASGAAKAASARGAASKTVTKSAAAKAAAKPATRKAPAAKAVAAKSVATDVAATPAKAPAKRSPRATAAPATTEAPAAAATAKPTARKPAVRKPATRKAAAKPAAAVEPAVVETAAAPAVASAEAVESSS